MRFDTPTVELHQALDQGESDAQAAACTDARRPRAGRHIKHPGKQLPGDPVVSRVSVTLIGLSGLEYIALLSMRAWLLHDS
jgi:hypothetical protein